MALPHEDDVGPDVYVGTDADLANAPLLPIPTAVPPPPLGSCERQHYKFHAAEGVHEHRLSAHGQQDAASLAGAMERFELQPPGKVAREAGLDVPMVSDQVCGVRLGDTTVLDSHPGDVRGAEPRECLPLAARLVARRLLGEAGLNGAAEEGLYVAVWRSSAEAWLPSHSKRPFTPPLLGSRAVLVALHPQGMEVALAPGKDGEARLSPAVGVAVLAPTSSSSHLAIRRGDPQVLVVVGTRQEAATRERVPKQYVIAVEGDTAGGTPASGAQGVEGAAAEGEPGEEQPETTG